MYMYANNWDEPYAEEECFECSAKDNKMDDVKYWFRAVLDQLYGLEEFNLEDLERYLDELAGVIDMKLPALDLSVVRNNRTTQPKASEPSGISGMLQDWVTLNNMYLKSLTHKNLGV